MGDSGAQVLGFALAALGLAASWNVAGSTVATLLLPILVLAVPVLDTTLVTIVRLLEGRPISQGGRDHSSHRLVRFGLSEKHAVLLLALIATALGATSLAYNVLDDQRLAIVGVLVTFVLLVQFASFLADVEQRGAPERRSAASLDAFAVHWRRLVEVRRRLRADHRLVRCRLRVRFGWPGTVYQRHLAEVDAADRDRGALSRVHPVRPLPLDLAVRRLARPGRDRWRGRRSPRSVALGYMALTRSVRRLLALVLRHRRAASAPPRSPLAPRRARSHRRHPHAPRPDRQADADRRRRPHGPQPRCASCARRRRARPRLRRRQPAPSPPPCPRGARCSAAHTRSPRSSREHDARHRARHDPRRAARAARTRSSRRATTPASPAGSYGARPTSTRASSSAPPPSERAHPARPAARRDPGRGARARRARALRVGGVEPEDADDLQRRARMGSALACDRRHRSRRGTRRAEAVQVALRVSDRAGLVVGLGRHGLRADQVPRHTFSCASRRCPSTSSRGCSCRRGSRSPPRSRRSSPRRCSTRHSSCPRRSRIPSSQPSRTSASARSPAAGGAGRSPRSSAAWSQPQVRGELAMLAGAYVLAAIVLFAAGPTSRRLRAGWSVLDHIGAGILASAP